MHPPKMETTLALLIHLGKNTSPGKGVTKDGMRWFHEASSWRIKMTISIDFLDSKRKIRSSDSAFLKS
jgi:hypothetical protein